MLKFLSVNWYRAADRSANDKTEFVLFFAVPTYTSDYIHPFLFWGKLGEIQAVSIIIQNKYRNPIYVTLLN